MSCSTVSRLLLFCAAGAIGSWILLPGDRAIAQIAPDLSLGSEQSFLNPNAEIKGLPATLIEGGAQRGEHLFHSFTDFNVGKTQRVYFANPTGIENILSRVTGNQVSNIFGTLGVNGGANLFFLNPQGILFGPHAQLDISGSFVASTASELTLGEASFSAIDPQAPPLLQVNVPIGLQHGTASGVIANRGNLFAGEHLTLSAGSLDLVGQIQARGNLTLSALEAVQIRDQGDAPFIAASGGDLLIQGGQVDIFALNHDQSGVFSGGDLVLRSPTPIIGDAHYWSRGNFRVEQLDGSLGNWASVTDPIIRSLGDVSFFAYQGASLHILAGGQVDVNTIVITGPDLFGESINPVSTPELANVTLSNGSSLSIDGSSRPTIDIRAGVRPEVIGEPLGTQAAFTGLFFDEGINIVPPPENNINLISSDITIGDISIDVPEGLVLLTNQYEPNLELEGGNISIVRTGFFGNGIILNAPGPGGDVILDARDSISVDNSDISITGVQGGSITLLSQGGILLDNASNLFTDSPIGASITLESQGNITLSQDSDIISDSSFGNIQGGLITLESEGDITFNSGSDIRAGRSFGDILGGTINIVSQGDFSLNSGGAITSDTAALVIGEKGGNIDISARSILLGGGASITTSAFGLSDTGDIILNAREDILLNGIDTMGFGSRVASRVGISSAPGSSGSIDLTAGSLTLNDGARIFTTTAGSGNAGAVTIRANDAISLNGADGANVASEISSNVGPFASGSAAGVNIMSHLLLLNDGAQIGSGSFFGFGEAGIVQIAATDLVSLTGQDADGAGSQIFSQINSLQPGTSGGIDIQAGSLLLDDGAVIGSVPLDLGNSGPISITVADSFVLRGTNGSGFGSTVTNVPGLSSAQGLSGGIDITTGSLELQDGANIETNTFGSVDSGQITIVATDMILLEGIDGDGIGSQISNQVEADATGSSPGIDVITGALIIRDGGFISASTLGQGNAGLININSANNISISGDNSNIISVVGSNATGSSLGINLISNSLELVNGGVISASTAGIGNSGSIAINTVGSIVLSGQDSQGVGSRITSLVNLDAVGNSGGINLNTLFLSLFDGAFIDASTSGQGDSGLININATDAIVLGRQGIVIEPVIISSVVNDGVIGRSSGIQLETSTLKLNQSAIISTTTRGEGNAGEITISADQITVLGGSQIQSSTLSNADAGDINLDISELLLLDGNGSAVFASTLEQSTGNGGSININPDEVVLSDGTTLVVDIANRNSLNAEFRNGGGITVESEGSGIGGTINVAAKQLALDRSVISAETDSTQGGNVNLTVADNIFLRRGSRISATAGRDQAGGDGGNIVVSNPAGFVIGFTSENTDITANAFAGDGGRITITSQGILGLTPSSQSSPFTSDITASSALGVDGEVILNTPDTDPSQGLTELPVQTQERELVATTCPVDQGSTFRVTGRGGLPEDPRQPIVGSSLWPGSQTTATAPPPKVATPVIQEARGWQVTDNGRIALISAPTHATSAWVQAFNCQDFIQQTSPANPPANL